MDSCRTDCGRVHRLLCRLMSMSLVLIFAGCASSGGSGPVATPVATPGSVTLQPGDKIHVEIWREEDLSGQFRVHEDGTVTFPLLGDRQVTNIPVQELRDTLVLAYRKELRNPSIEVVPLRNVLVLGAVQNPGPYEVNPITSVLGVIALAGGATSGGSLDKIQIRRGQETLQNGVAPGASLSSLSLRSGDQIVVGQRNWLMRNQSFVVSVILAIPTVVYTITRIGN